MMSICIILMNKLNEMNFDDRTIFIGNGLFDGNMNKLI